jgi:hypothetical protein
LRIGLYLLQPLIQVHHWRHNHGGNVLCAIHGLCLELIFVPLPTLASLPLRRVVSLLLAASHYKAWVPVGNVHERTTMRFHSLNGVPPSIYGRYCLMREPWPLLSQSLDRRWTLLGNTSIGMPHGRHVRGINDCLCSLECVSVVLKKFADLTTACEGGLASEATWRSVLTATGWVYLLLIILCFWRLVRLILRWGRTEAILIVLTTINRVKAWLYERRLLQAGSSWCLSREIHHLQLHVLSLQVTLRRNLI